MKLTEGNVRKATRKAATIEWMESLPEEHRFAPNSSCGCMYHDLLVAQFDVEYAYPTFDMIEAGELTIHIGERSFASRFQQAACAFIGQHRGEGRPTRNREPTITRDEAIAIAKGL